jgi:hypothetical protein
VSSRSQTEAENTREAGEVVVQQLKLKSLLYNNNKVKQCTNGPSYLPACLPAYYSFVQKLKELETMQLSSSTTTTTTVFKPSLLNTPETMQKGLEGIKKASQMGFLTLQKRKKETDATAAAADDDDDVADVKNQNNTPKKSQPAEP